MANEPSRLVELRNDLAQLEEQEKLLKQMLAIRRRCDSMWDRVVSGNVPDIRAVRAVTRAVCSESGLSVAQFRTKCRVPYVALSRQIIWFICSRGFNVRYWRLADLFNRQFSTVAHGVRTVKNLMDVDIKVRERVNGIIKSARKEYESGS